MIYGLIIGSLFVTMGLLIILKYNKKVSKCTCKTSATIVDIKRKSSNGSFIYFPVFEYVIDGESYTITSNCGSRPFRHNVGDSVELKYDPNDPNVYIALGYDTNKFIGICFMVGGFLFFCLMLFFK